MTPDITGEFRPIGAYNGKESYANDDNTWFIWWDNVNEWTISPIRGDKTPPVWSRVDPNIVGVYAPVEPSDGVATVAEL